MIINGRDYKINVLVLFMEGEADVTIMAVETLLESIEEGVTVSILLNGGTRSDLRELFTRSPHILYYESETNLGVAGGRNFLLFTKECLSSDIVMFVDNDVIPPVDYVRSLAKFLVNRKDAGIVGSTLLNIKPFFIDHDSRIKTSIGSFGNTIVTITNREIKKSLVNTFKSAKFYHIGTNADWFNAYFSSKELYEEICLSLGITKKKDFQSLLKHDKKTTLKYLNRKTKDIQVGNIGGGATAFFRSIVDEVGRLNDVFNPLGYEDADFSIRVLKKGYNNYTDPNTFLIHGTDNRQAERRKTNFMKIVENECRCLTLLYYLHFPDIFKELIHRRMLLNYIAKSFKGDTGMSEFLYFCVKGYKRACEQIELLESV